MEKLLRFGKEYYKIYQKTNFPRASAAMSYFITMTFFPFMICLYTLLGNSYDMAIRVLRFVENFISHENVMIIEDFLGYVARNHNQAMLVAGIMLFITTSSAMFRSMQATIGDMQGKRRYEGLMFFVSSLIFSVAFVAVTYFGVGVMLTGRAFIHWLNSLFPFIDISNSWNHIRFIVFGAIEFFMFLGVYSVCEPWHLAYRVWPGAVISTFATVIVSVVFSYFISESVKYQLVYGSIASLILLMLWLYMTCMVIYCGAAFNIALDRIKHDSEK